MTPPNIPNIEGLKTLTPLEMNSVHFDKRHTVLTPELLESMRNSSDSDSQQVQSPIQS